MNNFVSSNRLFYFHSLSLLYYDTYNDTFVFKWDSSDLQYITESRPYGEGKGTGLAIINLSDQKRIFKKATVTEDYSFIQLLDNGRIYFAI